MQAWTHSQAGHPTKVLTLSSIPIPTPKNDTEVLIKITHAALNPGGSIVMQLCPSMFRGKPCIPEMDFSGIILQAGSGIPESRGFKEGTEVFGSIPVGPHIKEGKGTLAKFVVVEHGCVAVKPGSLPSEQAAGLSVAGVTALELLRNSKLEKGDKVLINGASGGIGSLITQMVKDVVGREGAVVGVCSTDNIEMVKSLGANEVIDYRRYLPVHEQLTEKFGNEYFDIVIDARGVQDIFHNCPKFLKTGKPYVTVGPQPPAYNVLSMLNTIVQMMSNALWPRVLGGTDRPYVQVTGLANLKDLELLAEMAKDGKLKVPIDSQWDFAEVQKAYERMLSKHAKGKVIVNIETV